MKLNRQQIEKTGAGFDPEKLLAAREKTFQAVREIASVIRVGMAEEEAYELAKGAIARLGAEKNWHRPWIRFGSNTLKPYGELSEPGVRLGSNDIFFIDIGPVWNGYEGDGGDTFVTGNDPEMARCASDVKAIFNAVKEKWAEGKVTGIELYEFAQKAAAGRHWVLGLKEAAGHRLSDFPHAVHYRGVMGDIDFHPSPSAWMLEIQIRHPEKPFGAFYEDLLV